MSWFVRIQSGCRAFSISLWYGAILHDCDLLLSWCKDRYWSKVSHIHLIPSHSNVFSYHSPHAWGEHVSANYIVMWYPRVSFQLPWHHQYHLHHHHQRHHSLSLSSPSPRNTIINPCWFTHSRCDILAVWFSQLVKISKTFVPETFHIIFHQRDEHNNITASLS